MTSEVQAEKEELPSHVHPEVHESDVGTHIDTLEKKRSRCYAILLVAQNRLSLTCSRLLLSVLKCHSSL